MNSYSTNNTYPIINNANEYMLYKKTVSIHSEDRDITKYPNSSCFELELPQDYLNVSTVSLGNYNFPNSYNIFSLSPIGTKLNILFKVHLGKEFIVYIL